MTAPDDPESLRLRQDARRERNWKRWGPYLAERQWGTVREDYSADGEAWDYFPHDQARSRVYRWGEDGLLGCCDRQGRLCFAFALWNGEDPILKERLFGLGNREGNHGEDVKECYFYLDATPTHSYMKALYKYPHRAFPYRRLVDENARRSRFEPEFELTDTGIFEDDRYFDVFAEYAKAAPDDLLIKLTVHNRGPDPAPLHVLPTLWFRNTWSWGRAGEGYWHRPEIALSDDAHHLNARHQDLGTFTLHVQAPPYDPTRLISDPTRLISAPTRFLFTENETNNLRLWGTHNRTLFVKDAFHDHVVHGRHDRTNPEGRGTKAAAHLQQVIPAGGQMVVRVRLTTADGQRGNPWSDFDQVIESRRAEADQFYAGRLHPALTEVERAVVRQAYAGLLWSKQFYHYDVRAWQQGDPAHPAPPPARATVRNTDWGHLYNRDVLSMPDKWEYPWYAAWDLAFHMLPFAQVDGAFARDQLRLLLREWYMHPNGQLPAYEFAFSDANPPVHAWAAWRVYKISTDREGRRDRRFLEQVFHKLLLNFTWWVNRKDRLGRNLFGGGFLGLDNIGVFDRSKPLPVGGHLEQADGTAWMAFYAATMLSIALELARHEPVYEDLASKFFEHFVHIADAINAIGGHGLWHEEDGFYYDEIALGGEGIPLRVRSMVGLLPLIAVEVLDEETVARLPRFQRRMRWFLENRRDLAERVSFAEKCRGRALLALPSRDRLVRVLRYMLDENEFLSPHGIRSLSRVHADHPFRMNVGNSAHHVSYEPGESNTWLFGGNSNWRGPVWLPVNYLIVEALERYHHFYGDDLKVECPTGSGQMMTLHQVALEIGARLTRLFLPDAKGRRPCHGDDPRFARDPHWRNLVLFHEYFHGDDGRGLGASHQTGWTALALRLIEDQARQRRGD
jgi:hypothetical protein